MSPEIPVLGILASGRGSNCKAILQAVADGSLVARIALVLSDNPNAPVLAAAKRFGVEARFLDPGRPRARLKPDNERHYVSILRDAGVQWIALAGFMRILGAPTLEAYPGRILNIHPSLLPAFPGLDAVGQAFAYGTKVTGCTVHFVDAGVDTGPIVAQTAVPVMDGDTVEQLRERVLEQEHRTYVEALRAVLAGEVGITGRRVLRRPLED